MWDERKKTLMEFRKILFAGMAVLLMGRGWALEEGDGSSGCGCDTTTVHMSRKVTFPASKECT